MIQFWPVRYKGAHGQVFLQKKGCIFLHGYEREGVMSEPQQSPGVEEDLSLRIKATMLRMTEQNSGSYLGAYAVLNKPVLDPETLDFLLSEKISISHGLSHFQFSISHISHS